MSSSGNIYTLNQQLIEKTIKLLGIKGYYTNILQNKMINNEVISHYGNLWRVEHAFRMSKSDLVARPIFHYKEDSIKAHMVICFIALALRRYLELKCNISLRKFVGRLRWVQDARIVDMRTNNEVLVPPLISGDVRQLLDKLGVRY